MPRPGANTEFLEVAFVTDADGDVIGSLNQVLPIHLCTNHRTTAELAYLLCMSLYSLRETVLRAILDSQDPRHRDSSYLVHFAVEATPAVIGTLGPAGQWQLFHDVGTIQRLALLRQAADHWPLIPRAIRITSADTACPRPLCAPPDELQIVCLPQTLRTR